MLCYYFIEEKLEMKPRDEADFVNCREEKRTWFPDDTEHCINQTKA